MSSEEELENASYSDTDAASGNDEDTPQDAAGTARRLWLEAKDERWRLIIAAVCAVLGVALTNVQDGYNFIQCVTSGFGTAVGYTIAIVLLAGIRSRINEKDLPAPLRGAPIVMIAAALMSIAFMGFGGLVL